MILIDVVQLVTDGKGQELFAMQLISYLDSLKPRKRNRKIDVPVAIVFTKTDLCDEPIRDAESFARANTSSLYSQCRMRLERLSFHCSGVAGSTGRLVDRNGQEMLIPLRVEPRGIIEPFAWMVNQLLLTVSHIGAHLGNHLGIGGSVCGPNRPSSPRFPVAGGGAITWSPGLGVSARATHRPWRVGHRHMAR